MKELTLRPGKLYRVLLGFVAEKPEVDEVGDFWSSIEGVDPGEIFLYLGAYPPEHVTFKSDRKGMHHFLMGNGMILCSTFAFVHPDIRCRGAFAEEIKTDNPGSVDKRKNV